MDRILNFLFILTLMVLAVLVANHEEQMQLLIALVFAGAIGLLAFLLNLLTLDGAHAAVIVGTITLGIGGVAAAVILIVFFLTGSWLAKLNHFWHEKHKRPWEDTRRTGLQVWANGFWFCFFLVIWFATKQSMWYAVAVASLAVANADTWATEIGTLTDRFRTVLITNFKPVPAGVNGGVSLNGTIASVLGSTLIASIYGGLMVRGYSMDFLIIVICGVLGSIADSYLGALVQTDSLDVFVPGFTYEKLVIGNNVVNWMATGVGAVIAFLIYSVVKTI